MIIDTRELAILTVHGNSNVYMGDYAERFPWPRLQLEQLRRHTPAGYKVIAYGNELIPSHEAMLRSYPEVELTTSEQPMMRKLEHVWPARNWLVRQAFRRFRYLSMLDSDAFPVADGWLDRYAAMLSDEQPLVAVQRLENADQHSDRCFMLFTAQAFRTHAYDFSTFGAKDAGGGISADLEKHGFDWVKLNRSNAWNPHRITAAIYDHRIYHHGAGTRLPRYRKNRRSFDDPATRDHEILMHHGLMSLLFDDAADFAARLEGEKPPIPERQILQRGRTIVSLRTERRGIRAAAKTP